MGAAINRRPGRPARLSREAIVDAALAVLDRDPREPLTAARVAAAVDAVPAALYRHFAGLDELFDAILAAILGRIEVDVLLRRGWEDQLADWMKAVRVQVLRYPALAPLIGRAGRTSPAWLEVSTVPVEILQRAGVGSQHLASAHLWICETAIALAIQEAALSFDDQIRNAEASLDPLPEKSRARLQLVLGGLAGIDGDAFFAFVVDRAVDGVRSLARRRSRLARRGARRSSRGK